MNDYNDDDDGGDFLLWSSTVGEASTGHLRSAHTWKGINGLLF